MDKNKILDLNIDTEEILKEQTKDKFDHNNGSRFREE